jgi:endonuclease-3
VHNRLAVAYPGTAKDLCELDHRNPFELLVATILSAQSTDKMINSVTPTLFARYPDAAALAGADPLELQQMIRSTGFFQSKSRSLLGMASALVERFDGQVPARMADLTTLPGVGRKTANVVLSVAFAKPGLPVDTHVLRVSKRLALTFQDDPVKVEAELNPMVPAAQRGLFSLRMILHGRRVCVARAPACQACVLNDICPSSQVLPAGRRPRRPSITDP